ncbi:DJ-1/PfpI family protein [Fusobacterium perfoetens]|uniref:DJ-1/PfpI family protein n=1 Tax=Fusobacterium perfoetens TaxID=852 RepID=UPI000480C9E9|nr:DJ-1/PfpI family protein [Fusobacterium perfoetens]MCI6151854.1 DJ-1/PfpI family protein [Fusobacterium perfoetens]MDY3236785.1 DJ-1/PfpI family protein [Fusobacterium perfoetens]
MKKVYVLLGEGFELIEATVPIDILKRAKIKVVTLSLNKDIFVNSAQNILIKADDMFNEYKDGDCIILPGGYSGYENLFRSEECLKLIKYYLENKKLVVAISGAPLFLAKNNLINEKNITIHYSNSNLVGDICNILDNPIMIDDNLITVCGTGYMQDLGFKLIEILSPDKLQKVKKGMNIK